MPPDIYARFDRNDLNHARPQPVRLPLDPARRLDLEADALLQQGDHARAERLAHRAAALRGWSA